MKYIKNKSGFTLIELLVVVLIIGILAAVALPQYQKAVLKSRFAALMPIAKSIANGNEMYYLTHGQYAQNPAELDVAGQDAKYPDGTDLDMINSDKYSYVMATRDNNFPMNYIVYQKHSTNFPDNIHCEAAGTMAESVCQSLGGQVLESGSLHDGYTTYILKGSASDGQMPTSLSKLVAACEANANCTVSQQGGNTTIKECDKALTNALDTNIKTCTNITYDEDGEEKGYERTEQQCGQTISYHEDLGNMTYRVVGQERKGCVTRTYDENGTPIGYVALAQCSNYSEVVNGKCFQREWGPYHHINAHYANEDGFEIQTDTIVCKTTSTDRKTCVEYDSAASGFITYTPGDNGRVAQKRVLYCETFNNDGTCKTYDGQRSRFFDVTDKACSSGLCQTYGTVKTCDNFNADGSCATYSAKYHNYYNQNSISPSRLLCSVEQGNIDTTTGDCL